MSKNSKAIMMSIIYTQSSWSSWSLRSIMSESFGNLTILTKRANNIQHVIAGI
ncbi:hypothetical protein RO3G_07881 [Rhizopus delemar RA 99-880]|uniref:Uncharacterized protein n=1 Tax=Rhizopus delemar (strain RA 99-880 / ATCC MYA-4621 / FGSC 9543 / NRRL 43880) TaxID=246409 RepID=I1C3Z6_RHIO9|nr:hypothetical protein RO3G_07881 [Rhizopus delemar RA 99-880]|eukprot:EIE83176.1 hypothetical protein RO3G_07881 [Rhizopus delemar RA 99-880]